MSTFLQYRSLNTPLHRLHVVTKSIITLTLLALLVVWMDYRFFLFLDLVIVVMYVGAKVPISWLWLIPTILVTVFPLTLVLSTFLYSPALFRVYPLAEISKTFAMISLPFFGTLKLTYGGLLWTAGVTNRFMALPVFFLFVYTTPVSQMMDLLARMRVPKGMVLAVGAMFKFIPLLVSSFSTTIAAQKLRGWDLAAEKNPIRKVRKAMPLLIPMLRSTSFVADELTLAAEIRGFGSSARYTPIREFKLSIPDYLMCSGFVVLLVSAFTMYVQYGTGLI